MLSDIKYVKLTKYVPKMYNITLPTHYNKHEILVDSYKYDINSHALNFIIYKIKENELKFVIDDKYTEEDFLKYIYSIKTHKDAKKIYTKLSGLLVRETKEYYHELIRSSVYVMEQLLELNRKLGLDFKILKVYVDEFIVDKPLLIKNIKNDFLYNFNESKFYLFVKSVETLNKQLYITDDGLEINHSFSKSKNLITDLSDIWKRGCSFDDINILTSDIINNRYSVTKLYQIDSNEKEFIYTSEGVKVETKFIDPLSVKYSADYYYNIYQKLASNMVLAKQFL